MLLILFWIFCLMFYFSYLFTVLFLVFLVLLLMLFYMANVMYVKFLIVLVYLSGVVIFMLYISCMCWNNGDKISKWFVLLGLPVYFFFDQGMVNIFSELGYFGWMFIFFSFLFNFLVMSYSLNLFKVSGSLRF